MRQSLHMGSFGQYAAKGIAALFACLISAGNGHSQQAVTTHHYDQYRTGWNANETKLSVQALKSGTFGLLKSVALDDQVDAQPLFLPNVSFQGASHSVVYVVTAKNSIYAIDGKTGAILKQRQLGTPVPYEKIQKCGNNAPILGITSTPVIDAATQTLYLISFKLIADTPAYYIHALDVATLEDKIPAKEIKAVSKLADGTVYDFNPGVSRQRPGLLLTHGKVYAGFGSFCDFDGAKTRGWVLGWIAGTLEPLIPPRLNDTRVTSFNNSFLSAIWMSGYGIGADEEGNLFFTTGNSLTGKNKDQAPSPPVDVATVLPNSVIKLAGDLSHPMDYFTPSKPPFDLAILERRDLDFSSGGVLVVPKKDGPGPRLAVSSGKAGQMYLFNRDDLGKYDPSGTEHVLATVDIGKCWCGPAYFVGADGVGRVVSSGGDMMTVWKIDAASPATPTLVKDFTASESFVSNVFQKGFFTSVSSNGQNPGSAIIWAVKRPTARPPVLTLAAFDAQDGTTLFTSEAGNWPNTGGGANTVPVVADGQVYIASNAELRIFGLGAAAASKGRESAKVVSSREAAKASVGKAAQIYGTVVEVSGSLMSLRTRSALVSVDITSAETKQRSSPLNPGQAVAVAGVVGEKGIVQADTISYANDSPSLWPEDRGLPQ